MSLSSLIWRSGSEFLEDGGPTQAAALAFYTVFSLPSLLLIMIYVAGIFFGRAEAGSQIQNQAGRLLGGGIGSQFQGLATAAARTASSGGIATVFGIAGLLFAATSAFSQLQTALNRMWEVRDRSGVRNILKKRFFSFLLIIGISILVLASLGAVTFLTYLGEHSGLPLPAGVTYAGQILVSWVVFALLFGTIFKVLPDAEVAWKDVKVGAMITAGLFVAGKFLIGYYLSRSSTASAYRAAGALAILLLWAYYSSMIFLFGAELTQVWARLHGRAIQPEPEFVHR